ncbi:chemotaxis protein CheA [Noviherbaspirillum autotrophicum]|uniref:Chemotaxis protein CheA n=1 Tax=Noviherbaspirillum autotrophicum TaxID=709839 RepID=A0A0C1YPI5_9BURK|nr:chemotaxis protein CheA [Noviherbaspirillum autotrophicum]KIF82477.1 chemotaxis protein CheA [Noviherbaspirillum autotrophicum]
MNLEQALQTFFVESRELLEDMESALLAAEQAESRTELVNAIFRAAHTIKGSAGLFGLDHIVAFTHVVESVLDQVRDARIQLTGQLVTLLLACRDHLSLLIDMVEAGRLEADDAASEAAAPLIRQLREYLDATPMTALQVAGVPEETHASAFERMGESGGSSDYWHISLRFGSDVLRNGMDPMSFIRYLGTIGRIVGIATLADAMPANESMDPESCYLGFEIAFDSDADKAAIENVFEFVRDDCRLRILPPNSRISDYVRLIRELPEEVPRLGEILVRCGSVTAAELENALKEQADAKPSQRLGEILVEQGAVPGVVVDAAIAKQHHASDQFRTQEARSIRVDADKLDHLINLIGELIIASASANLVARRARNDELQEAASILSGLVEEVRDSALQLRMVKIGATFSRFQRVVYDVSRELGKDIRLVLSGEETELDKTVVEKIADPLTHLVRNAIDHGIEPAELRAARGKPAQGMVQLNAYHDSGSIVIEVSDDGGGLKRDKILARAIERGLVEPGRALSDSEIYALIFEPGFSTADQVTNLSGRGVGMDVVKRNITALRGGVDVQSEEGAGTKVVVRLPLTLAIINGFLVGLGGSTFVIPLDMIEECIEFSCEPGHDYTNLRGEVLPFIRLRELFGVAGAAGRRESIVVVNYAGKKAGLVVDTLLGEFQTVIKPLGKMFGHLRCISGSTILGNGEVALILDVPMLVQEVANQETQAA